ncbi:MAG: ABC transporter substrate-binding protein [Xanthobacteraceae bacterium]
MRRREFITLVGGMAASWPHVARGQQATMRRVGVLMGWEESDRATQSLFAAFRDALAKLGWAEGGDLRIELRWGNGSAARIEMFSKELVNLRPDAILGQTTPVVRALALETRTIPIVFVQVSDPIGGGFAKSLARPSGNITGFTTDNSAQGGKWVEVLKEIAPHTTRVALLFHPETAVPPTIFMPSIQAAASAFGIQAIAAPVHAKNEIEGVIAGQAKNPGGGLIVTPDPFNAANRDLIIALAARYRVPAIYFNGFFADSGGLIVYGSVFAEEFRQAAGYIDRIIKGEKAADLPVQAPTKYELVINLKTAKALGLTVPSMLLTRADRVIE